jgi:hypothetical protein
MVMGADHGEPVALLGVVCDRVLNPEESRNFHLCPVCLHKLQWNLKFDVRQRYRQLRDIYKQSHYEDLSAWMGRRLARLEVTAQE